MATKKQRAPQRPRKRYEVKIGPVIRRWRLERDWSQERLAQEAGISTVHVGVLERGAKLPTLETLACIADAFGARMSEMLAEMEEGS